MKRFCFVSLLGLTLLAGCQTKPHPDLFIALGGMNGIENIVDDFLLGLGNDNRIAHHFAEADPDRLRDKLIEQFCAEAGGGCRYTGDSMQDVHRGMNISHADFNALVEVLIEALDRQDVPVAAQNRLLQRLAPMHGDIVGH